MLGLFPRIFLLLLSFAMSLSLLSLSLRVLLVCCRSIVKFLFRLAPRDGRHVISPLCWMLAKKTNRFLLPNGCASGCMLQSKFLLDKELNRLYGGNNGVGDMIVVLCMWKLIGAIIIKNASKGVSSTKTKFQTRACFTSLIKKRKRRPNH